MTNIYVLKDELGEIRYVGQTSYSLTHRLSGHISEAKCRKLNFYRLTWIRSMLNRGLSPTIHLILQCEDYEADYYERQFQLYYESKGYKLTNTAICGQPNAMKGRKFTEEQKIKMSQERKGKQIGIKNGMYKKHHTEESKEKMSKKRKGQINYWKHKPVLQFDLDGIFIKEWSFIRDIQKELKINQSSITKVCKNKLKSAGGFIWEYKIGYKS